MCCNGATCTSWTTCVANSCAATCF
jgi:hypothetical protein